MFRTLLASLVLPVLAAAGPDVTAHDLIDMEYYGTVGGINAYAIGTNACNIGDIPVDWIADNPHHPVIAQNMYRLKDGRFEQVGLSWLKHAFASLNSPGCGTCVQPFGGNTQLGVGCADAYGTFYNGHQAGLGPRAEVNVTTGAFIYPFGGAAYFGSIARRLQVRQADVDPAVNEGSLYFAEAQFITLDDAYYGNALNNNSWRPITVASTGVPVFSGPTVRYQPAIHAWRAHDPAVTLAHADYIESFITARFVVGSKATANPDFTWTYEYAVQNLNSHRSASGFSIPRSPGVTVTNAGFHDAFYHSGEPFSGADWTAAVGASDIAWSTQSYAQNPFANALRFGTLYNFRFTASTPPTPGQASITLFRTGAPTAITADALVPGPACDFDLNADGNVDQNDVGCIIDAVAGNPACTTLDPDINHDGNVDQEDVAAVINGVAGGGCP